MKMGSGIDEEAERLVKRAKEDPNTVPIEAVVELLRATNTYDERPIEIAERLIEANPGRAQALVESFIPLLAADRDCTKSVAAGVICAVADTDPTTAQCAVPALAELLNAETPVPRNEAVGALTRIAQYHPESVGEILPALAPVLEGFVLFDRIAALWLVTEVVATQPAAGVGLVPQLIGNLREEYGPKREPYDEQIEPLIKNNRTRVETTGLRAEDVEQERHEYELARNQAAAALAVVTHACPTEVCEIIEIRELGYALDDDNSAVQGPVVATLSAIAETSPKAVLPVYRELVTLAADEKCPESVRGHAVHVLAIVADEYHDTIATAVQPTIPELQDLLIADEATARGSVATLFSYVAERYPDAVKPTRNRLCGLLDDDEGYVRESAKWALQILDEPSRRNSKK